MSLESSEQTGQPENGDKAVALQYLDLQKKYIELQGKKIDYQLKELTHDSEYDKEQLRSDHVIALRDMEVNQEKNRNEHEYKKTALKYGAGIAVLFILCSFVGFILLVVYTPNGNSKIIESLFNSIEGIVKYILAALAGAGGIKLFEKIKSAKNVKKMEETEGID